MPLQKFPASSPGFTLIELLVTIGILIILIGGSIAGFIRFRDNQQAFTAAKEVQQLMRLAQSKAAANIYPTATTTCDKIVSNKYLQGYRVSNAGGIFSVSPICGSTRTSVTAATAIQTYRVPTGITTTGGTVDFYTLSGGANPARTYSFRVTAGTRTHSFDVTTTGSISDVAKTAD
jgi:type II secretory pathway pseudopilin PulG